MNYWMNKSTIIVFLVSILLIVSCATDNTCNQTKYVTLTADFFQVHYNDTTKIRTIYSISDTMTIQGLRLDTLTRKYTPVDSILYNNSAQSTIYLPLNNFLTYSTFKLKFKTLSDTMTIYHTNLNDYLSLECGCIVLHKVDTVTITRHFIDSVRITSHNVNTTITENIRLYSHK
jgi:hypothetical protein